MSDRRPAGCPAARHDQAGWVSGRKGAGEKFKAPDAKPDGLPSPRAAAVLSICRVSVERYSAGRIFEVGHG